MNKVLVVGFTANPGGIESVVMNYYRNIDRKVVQFDFLKNTSSMAYEEEIKAMGGQIFKITSKSKNYSKYKKELKDVFNKHGKEYDAIWVNFCEITNLDYLKLAKKYGIKKRILHSHNSNNMASKIHLLLHKINKKFVNKFVTDFWACSEEAAKWFFSKSVIKKHKYKIINNAIDIKKYKYNKKIRVLERKELGIDPETLVIGNIGRLQYQKNQQFLIEIFAKVLEKNNNSLLLIIGDGVERENLLNTVKRMNLDKNVRFLGVIDDINNKLQIMDIFLFPSRFEGLPVTLFEAQANGLKCFASERVIPYESKVSENLEFISLNKDAEFWADKIVNCKYSRMDNSNIIKKHGYDIRIESMKLQKEFMSKGEK